MEQEIGLFYWDNSYNATMLLSFAIIVALFASLRWFSGVISHIDPSYELTQKDNAAFGVSMAGVVFGVTLVLTGLIPNSWAMTLQESVIAIGVYGVIGIVLMAVTRIIFDRITLPHISIRDEIVKGNLAAAITDAGNVIAAAVVINAVMSWIQVNSLDGIWSLLMVYIVSQALLTAVAVLHLRMFAKRTDGHDLEKVLSEGNTAQALRFSGRRIGIAFAITAASNIMVYEIHEVSHLLMSWTLISLLVIVVLVVFSWLATKIILVGVDLDDEVLNQRNVALGAVQGVIYIALGLILSSLMS